MLQATIALPVPTILGVFLKALTSELSYEMIITSDLLLVQNF